jgi:hypothetical protein
MSVLWCAHAEQATNRHKNYSSSLLTIPKYRWFRCSLVARNLLFFFQIFKQMCSLYQSFTQNTDSQGLKDDNDRTKTTIRSLFTWQVNKNKSAWDKWMHQVSKPTCWFIKNSSAKGMAKIIKKKSILGPKYCKSLIFTLVFYQTTYNV